MIKIAVLIELIIKRDNGWKHIWKEEGRKIFLQQQREKNRIYKENKRQDISYKSKEKMKNKDYMKEKRKE